MTNTDTADVAGDGRPGGGAGARGQRAGARDGQHRGGRGGGAGDRRGAATAIGVARADHRRLPLQRPPAAHAVSGLRPRAGQVPHQSRQRRRQAPRRELPRDHRSRAGERQAGAHRRQLGLARSDALLTAHDGRQRAAGRAAGRARRDDGRHGRERASVRARSPRRTAWPTTGSSSAPRCRGVQDLVDVYRMLAARVRLSAAPRTHRGRPWREGHRREHGRARVLLQEGIGDTIRVSLTPAPGGDRTEEVRVAQQILQSLGLRSFTPQVTGCPGLRPHHEHLLPADGGGDPGLPARPDAGLAQRASRRRGAEGGGDGVCRERSRGVEARQHRHLAAGHLRGARRRRSTWTGG